jgi:hypothetical protein
VSSRGVARAVSIALHPLVVLLVATAARTRRWLDVLIVAGVVAVPFTLLLVREVRRGKWTNVDASRPEERPRLFVMSLAAVGALALALLVAPSSAGIGRGVAIVAAMFLAAWALLRWVKVSLHLACAAFGAVTMLYTAPAAGITLIALLPLLAWSRIKLQRHTWIEIVAGVVLGTASGAAAVFMP